MKKMIWLTVSFVIVLVFVVPTVLASLLKMIPGNVQPGYNSNYRLSIYGQRDMTQKLVVGESNLTAIGTSIRNPNLKNKSDVIFSLYDEGGNLVRTVTINGQNIEDGSFIKFTFPVISDSAGKEFSFKLSSPGAGPEETLEVFIMDKPDSESGIIEYSYMEEMHSGGVPLVTFSLPGSKLQTIKTVYSSLISRLL